MIWTCRRGWAQIHDFLQERSETLSGVAGRRLSVDPAGGRFQRRIEGQGAMPVVLEAMALGGAGSQRQRRTEAVQGLKGGLLIHAKDGRMLRRLQAQPDDIGGLSRLFYPLTYR